ncbi:hypothetical protein TCE0_022f06354 [Talaromyces pinophilus]|uniref:Uncharacterized protein n=1 Tax=Talaromyces pinophilus TaxID=128442 RepID=A0A6V8H785_TALPI|nr:hypothetical protein TCE0_022f06354 [Talaromyces pinophilus]
MRRYILAARGYIDEIDGGEDHEERKRQPVKRACNECRQQKLRCDVIQEPFMDCSRCRRLKLECKIESNFKRVGKRSRNAEMEREIIELRRQIANANATNASLKTQVTPAKQDASAMSTPLSGAMYQTPTPLSTDQYMGSHEAVASLLDLRSGFDGQNYMRSGSHQFKRIEDVMVATDRINELFNLFFTFYHPYLPFLDREVAPEEYYAMSPLLFWMIISVGARRYQTDIQLLNSLAGPVTRLVWSTIADIPQSFHAVKALCLLCTWPFPTSSTSTDPTFMLSGLMIHVAMQLGLHRPSHTQDFSKFRVELIESELRDKVRTWAICNVVAQRVATGYGQPPSTLYDWTLGAGELIDPSFRLPREIKTRLQIEVFVDKVTKALYNNRRNPVGLAEESERSSLISFLTRDFEELEDQLKPENDVITDLYLKAANLHLQLCSFFDDPSSQGYRERLLSLHSATCNFLELALNLETNVGPVLPYTPYYIYQIMLAAGFTLMKLCKSFFSAHIDLEYTKRLFNRTIWSIRAISVSNNDLPQRLTEVMTQMWKQGGAPTPRPASASSEIDDQLQLKVRCRMSMSLVFDSVWRWREDALAKASLKNPTDPDSNGDTAGSSLAPRTSSTTPGVTGDPSLAPAPALPHGLSLSSSSTGVNNLPSGFMEPNYEVFDPLNWLLDGLVDFPYTMPMQAIRPQMAAQKRKAPNGASSSAPKRSISSQPNGHSQTNDITTPHPGAQQAEDFGIVLREFYPPEMSNARCEAYNNGTLERPIDTLNRAYAETDQTRKDIKPRNAVVHWFKGDLRLKDNRALKMASDMATKNGVPLICMYINSPQDLTAHLSSPARVDFTLRNLRVLQRKLDGLGIPLYMETQERRRDVPGRIAELCEQWGASHVFANIEYEVDELRREAKLVRLLADKGVAFETAHDSCVVTPGALQSQQGKQYAVYSPWYRAWMAYLHQHDDQNLNVLDAPGRNHESARKHFKDLFDSPIPDAPENKRLSDEEKQRFEKMYPEGEEEAMKRLDTFIKTKAKEYNKMRSMVDGQHTTILSPYFAAGVLSARTAVSKAKNANNGYLDGKNAGLASWISEVAWRDFYKHVLVHWPFICMNKCFKPEFTNVNWEYDTDLFTLWTEGRTGFPIVDAAMRQLKHDAWMHNRNRMIVSSFLSKDLMIDWRRGERYFMESLIDGDFASNHGGWGFGSSTGVDPQPYFRIFNPLLQSEKFDPNGDFIRKWVPELRAIKDKKAIHDPYARGAGAVAQKAGYPRPVVEHAKSRDRALMRYKEGIERNRPRRI